MEDVVASGNWLYAGTTPTSVRVVRLDYDFWHAVGEANGDLPPQERPRLNAEGFRYYVRLKPGWVPGGPFWPDSLGASSVAEAMCQAQAQLPSPIRWDRDGQAPE